MAVYEDLAPLSEFGEQHAPYLLAIGWLGEKSIYSTGRAEMSFVDQLRELLVSPFEPVVAGGVHTCELCQFDGPVGSHNLFIPGDSVLFVMPELALHYMAAHYYLPPKAFRDAVMSCPEMRSMEYRRRFLASGGRGLLSANHSRDHQTLER